MHYPLVTFTATLVLNVLGLVPAFLRAVTRRRPKEALELLGALVFVTIITTMLLTSVLVQGASQYGARVFQRLAEA